MKCNCNDWAENINKVSDPIIFQAIHGMGGYKGKCFIYCPWCGKKLIDEDTEEKEAKGERAI